MSYTPLTKYGEPPLKHPIGTRVNGWTVRAIIWSHGERCVMCTDKDDVVAVWPESTFAQLARRRSRGGR